MLPVVRTARLRAASRCCARGQTGPRRRAPSADYRRALRRWWWRNWRSRHRHRPGGRCAGSGLAGTSSHDRTSIQRRPSRLIWIVFTRPTTCAVRADLDLPDALQIHPAGARAASGRRHRLWATPHCRTGPLPLNRGYPGFCAGFHPAEEPVERLVQPAQRGLLDSRTTTPPASGRAAPDLRQLRRTDPP